MEGQRCAQMVSKPFNDMDYNQKVFHDPQHYWPELF